jgi:hypothetical protein
MEDNATTFTLNTSHDDRSWHLTCREDKSVCLYWTRDSDPGQYVVYDSLDDASLHRIMQESEEVKALAQSVKAINDDLSQQVAKLSVELGIALKQRDDLRTAMLHIRDYASARFCGIAREDYLAKTA